jgi:hypothetical protein
VDASVGLVGSGTSLNALSGTAWNVYDSIPGWTTVSGSGIEVQRGTVIAPHSGAFYVELDSHRNATNSGSTNTRMSQNLGALALGVYDLSFYYSPRTSNATSMDIAFDLAGGAAFSDTVGFVDGAVGSWTLITRSFAVTSGTDVVLSFTAGGRGGSTRRLHRRCVDHWAGADPASGRRLAAGGRVGRARLRTPALTRRACGAAPAPVVLRAGAASGAGDDQHCRGRPRRPEL